MTIKVDNYGVVQSTPRAYHSLDFDSAKIRLKEEQDNWHNDPYQVHIEDYESINDMVRRCVKTKTKLPVEPLQEKMFDTDEDIANALGYTDRQPKPESVSEQGKSDGKQSEPEDQPISESSGSEVAQ